MPRDYRAARAEHQPDEPPPDPNATHCPGPCNAAYRAAETRYEKTGLDHDLEPRPGRPVWCPPCVTLIRTALDDWPALAARLAEEIESGVSAALNEYVSGSKNRPIHEHEAPSLLLDEFAEWIGEWEDTVRYEREVRMRRTAPADRGAAITAACAFLPAHLDWHLNGRDPHDDDQRTATQDFGTQLLTYHRRAQLLTGTQDVEPVRVIGVPCPMCDRKTLEHEVESSAIRRAPAARYRYDERGEVAALYRPIGPGRTAKITDAAVTPLEGAVTGYVKCRHCKPVFRMTGEEYHRWTRMLAAGETVRALATREKLAEVFGSSVPAQYARAAQ